MDSRTRQIYTDLYRFHEKYSGMENTVEAWTRCADEMIDIINRKYQGDEFVEDVFYCIYRQLEREVTGRND